MKTIIVATVFVNLDFDSIKRTVGWWSSWENAKNGLDSFGDESLYSYAVLEEFAEGLHPFTVKKQWYRFNKVWETFVPDDNNSFCHCINFGIG